MNQNGSAASTVPALCVRNVSKAFGSTQALQDVSFELAPGTIHALLGGNGSGKSTLIRILAGVTKADSGAVEIEGRSFAVSQLSPAVALASSLHFVHQQSSTFPDLTIVENLAIGRGFETSAVGTIRRRLVRDRTRDILARFDLEWDPDTLLADLSPATRTVVAIARALQDQEGTSSGILVLDEPTAALPKPEVDLLLAALRRYAQAGQSILYVTHRLEEAVQIADCASVLRDGHLAATVSEFDHGTLASLIMGREMAQLESSMRDGEDGQAVLHAEQIVAGPVRGFSFTVHEGEILGIAGVLGSGRSTLLRALFGATELETGSLILDGRRLTIRHPRDAIDAGIAFIPEDRHGEAAFATLDLTENISAATVSDYWKRGRIDLGSERRATRELMQSFAVIASSERAPFTSLSGGNQQKAILARWLRKQPRVLLLDEPTQGVDIGARVDIWKLVRASVDGGGAAVVVSSDLEELATVCDRAIVLRAGRVAGELRGDELTEALLNQMAYASEMVTPAAVTDRLAETPEASPDAGDPGAIRRNGK